MKTYILCLFFLLFCFAEGALFVKVPPTLQREVEMLEHFPDTQDFMNSLEGDKPITLTWMGFQGSQAHAFWSAEKRLIALNSSRRWDSGEKLYSILFELHNAQASAQLNHLDRQAARKEISKKDYVEAVERIEYNNVLKSSRLLERGVRSGYFPRETGIPQVPHFKEHYKIQQECGHAGHIAQKYELLCSYPLPRYLK